MKAIIITSDGPEHRFVTKCLVESLGDHLCGIVIERGKKIGLAKSLKRAARRYGLFKVIERLITKFVRKILMAQKRQLMALYEVLGHISPETYIPDDMPVLEVASVNENECLKWIKERNIDYAFAYGTGILGKKVLSLPSVQVLNLHTGISPFYRGSACAFWPLYYNDPLMIGSTVHKCTPEVDGGDIYGRVSVKLSENDDPNIAFAKSVKAGSILYANIAERLVNGRKVSSEKQDFSQGREYKFKEKTFVQEIVMEYRVFSGSMKNTISSVRNSPLPFFNPDAED